MTDYTELVKELREYSGCRKGELARITSDAAAAIEALLKENKELIEDHPEMVEADGHWEWRKQNGEVLMPKRGELTADEIETIRIHMNAIKERLCNQNRHNEAEEYQVIVDKLAKMREVQE